MQAHRFDSIDRLHSAAQSRSFAWGWWQLAILLLVLFAARGSFAGCFEEAEVFRRSVEIPAGVPLLGEYLIETPTELEAPMAEVYDQKGTQWCWAYSAYHSLRTYYLNTADTGEEVQKWKEAFVALDSHEAFKTYMGSHFSTGTTGDPINFIRSLHKNWTAPNLPAHTWKVYTPSRGSIRLSVDRGIDPELEAPEVDRIPMKEIASKIRASLERGIAVPYCYPWHCVSIYGAVYDGETPKEYLIGDSSGGRRYRSDAAKVHQKLDLITTRL